MGVEGAAGPGAEVAALEGVAMVMVMMMRGWPVGADE